MDEFTVQSICLVQLIVSNDISWVVTAKRMNGEIFMQVVISSIIQLFSALAWHSYTHCYLRHYLQLLHIQQHIHHSLSSNNVKWSSDSGTLVEVSVLSMSAC